VSSRLGCVKSMLVWLLDWLVARSYIECFTLAIKQHVCTVCQLLSFWHNLNGHTHTIPQHRAQRLLRRQGSKATYCDSFLRLQIRKALQGATTRSILIQDVDQV